MNDSRGGPNYLAIESEQAPNSCRVLAIRSSGVRMWFVAAEDAWSWLDREFVVPTDDDTSDNL